MAKIKYDLKFLKIVDLFNDILAKVTTDVTASIMKPLMPLNNDESNCNMGR